MSKRSRNQKWLMGFETKRVRCPDGGVRTLTFKDYIWWQDAWSRRDASALDKFDAIYGPGKRGSTVLTEPRAAAAPKASLVGTAGSTLTKALAARLRAKGHMV